MFFFCVFSLKGNSFELVFDFHAGWVEFDFHAGEMVFDFHAGWVALEEGKNSTLIKF